MEKWEELRIELTRGVLDQQAGGPGFSPQFTNTEMEERVNMLGVKKQELKPKNRNI